MARIERTSARLRQRMKSMLVLSGTSFSRLHRRVLRYAARVGRLRRTQSATSIRVKLTAVNTEVTMPIISTTAKPRIGPEPKYNISTAGDDVGDVGVEDRGRRFRVAVLDRVEDLAAAPLLLADALVDQHVGVDRGADRQHEAGDAGQGQRGVEHRHDAEDQQRVHDQAERRVDAEAAVGDQHEQDHRDGRDDAGDDALLGSNPCRARDRRCAPRSRSASPAACPRRARRRARWRSRP